MIALTESFWNGLEATNRVGRRLGLRSCLVLSGPRLQWLEVLLMRKKRAVPTSPT